MFLFLTNLGCILYLILLKRFYQFEFERLFWSSCTAFKAWYFTYIKPAILIRKYCRNFKILNPDYNSNLILKVKFAFIIWFNELTKQRNRRMKLKICFFALILLMGYSCHKNPTKPKPKDFAFAIYFLQEDSLKIKHVYEEDLKSLQILEK